MERASGKSKLNVRHISLGHGDSDPYIEVENSYTRSKRRIAKLVNLTSQPVATVIRHQQQQKNEQDTEHRKPLEEILKMFGIIAMFLGIDMNHQWKPTSHFRFIFIIFLLAFSGMCLFYTEAMHIKNGDYMRVLEPFSILGVSISLFLIGVVICVNFFLACPLKAYFVDNELISLLPYEIIFVDQSTYSGFIVANGVMLILGLFSAFGLVMYGSVFIFGIFMYSLKVDLIEQDLKDLDAMWTDKNTIPIAYKHAYLRNIFQKRQDLNDFMCEIKDIFETKLFYYFVSNYFSQIICLFEVTKNQWTPGYAIALVSFIEMMFYCYMGTKITIADEKLFSAIGATNWYTYDLYSQKMIILLLHQSETPNELQLGPIGPLNVITGITVVKSIYSYYTVMTELL